MPTRKRSTTAKPTPLRGVEHVHTTDDQSIAITSLVRRGDQLWCGLTAGRYALVPFDLKSKRFGKPVDVFPWVDDRPQVVLSKIHNALGVLDDGRLVIGEGILYSWDGLPFEWQGDPATHERASARRRVHGLSPLDPKRHGLTDLASFDLRVMTGGKILLYDPDTAKLDTVGQVQPFNYVQSMIVDPRRRVAYGHTLGDCHFFVADLDKKRVEDHGRISMFGFHNLCLIDGVVYGAWIDKDAREALRVMRFDPAKGFVERLRDCYLDDAGPRVQGNRGIDQWLVHSDGTVYVGMAGDGALYRFDPQKLTTRRVCKIGAGGRVTALEEDERGRVVLTAGFPRMHVGRFDPKTGAAEDLGPVCPQYEHIYFHGSVYADGTLWLAETDAGVTSLWEVPLPP